jgi:hypothetical protein
VSLNRQLDASPRLPFTSECPRVWAPPRLND